MGHHCQSVFNPASRQATEAHLSPSGRAVLATRPACRAALLLRSSRKVMVAACSLCSLLHDMDNITNQITRRSERRGGGGNTATATATSRADTSKTRVHGGSYFRTCDFRVGSQTSPPPIAFIMAAGAQGHRADHRQRLPQTTTSCRQRWKPIRDYTSQKSHSALG